MALIDILIGSELELHREALRATLVSMRPELDVRSVPYDQLDDQVSELRPLLVISSFVGSSRPGSTPAWITLYPDERDEAIVTLDGIDRVIPNATIDQILGVMDEVLASR